MDFTPEILTVNYTYSKKVLADLISDPIIELVREGRYRVLNWLLLFVTLDKDKAKNENVKYNDFFGEGVFFWESQHQQSLKSPMIRAIINRTLTPLLFVRQYEKVRGKTQEFVYAGKLEYLKHDPNSSNPVKFAFSTPDILEPVKPPLRTLLDWKPLGAHAHGVPQALVEGAKKKLLSRKVEGQGFEPDPLVRRAIELWAMKKARTQYERNGYLVRDVSMNQPYDLFCEKDGKRSRKVEVKGTRGDGSIVVLTSNEVSSALDKSSITDLAICFGVVVDISGEEPRAHSGRLRIIQKWRPDRNSLQPIQFRYKVPTSQSPDQH